jgi:hypothetical protein
MVTRTDIAGIAGAAPVAAALPVAALGDPSQESLRRLTALETGKAFEAQVLSRLGNGEFVVGIADTAARMALPGGTRVGDQLSLTLVAREPRPLFMLERPAALDAAVLSPAARLIAGLLQNSPASQPPLPGIAPLAPSADALLPAPLETALKDSLAYSGLFYESHVADWANGARPMAQLQREPQMQAAHVKPPGVESELRSYQAGAGTMADGAAPRPLAAMDLDAGRLITQQLDTLEQRSVSWHGELFPGQPMQWEVREESGGAGSVVPPAERGWQSVLRFELPTLGRVAATLQLHGGHLQLSVQTGSDSAAAALRAQGGELAAALQAAGLPLDLMTVKHVPA